MGCESIVKFFFTATLNIKLYHWQTKVYARHKASDELFSNLLESMDSFIEVYSGKYTIPKFNNEFQIPVNELSDTMIVVYLQECAKYLGNDFDGLIKKSDTDLLTIRDTLLSQINQALYLFTLR